MCSSLFRFRQGEYEVGLRNVKQPVQASRSLELRPNHLNDRNVFLRFSIQQRGSSNYVLILIREEFPPTALVYFNHIDQVKRGLRPRSPRPSGPLVRIGRAASLGGVFAFLISSWFQYSSSRLYLCKQRSNRMAAKRDASPPYIRTEHHSLSPVRDSGRVKGTD